MLELIAYAYLFSGFLAVLTWVGMLFAICMIADEKGRSGLAAFFAALFFPIPAAVYYIAVPSLKPVRAIPVAGPGALTAREVFA